MPTPENKLAKKLIIWTLVVYTALVLTHLGEFWPFSIYPMFSQGGKSWERSLVRELPESEVNGALWTVVDANDMPGAAFPLAQTNIIQNDLSNFLSKNTDWSDSRVGGILQMFGESANDRHLVVYKVVGRLDESREVIVEATPLIHVNDSSFALNPILVRHDEAN